MRQPDDLRCRVLPASDRCDEPWRNGGGSTQEVAKLLGPSGEFDWRISMARVEEDGAFSSFPGVTRTITVVQGGDLGLIVSGVRHEVRAGGEPFTFHGGASTFAELRGGSLTDLNVMVRDGRFAARVARIGPESTPVFAIAPPVPRQTLVLIASEFGVDMKLRYSVRCTRSARILEFMRQLQPYDAIIVDDVDGSLVIDTASDAFFPGDRSCIAVVLSPNA